MKRHGFTLIELLVVISIIGVLAALLLPAINAAREQGRQATCLNNQRQLALAARNFAASQGHYPGWKNELKVDTTTSREVSWLVVLLPYLERRDLYDRWADGVGGTEVVPLEFAVCPSNPEDGPNDLAYAVNAGIPAANKKTAGVFLNTVGFSDRMSSDFLGVNDGESNTLMLTENLQATNWGGLDRDRLAVHWEPDTVNKPTDYSLWGLPMKWINEDLDASGGNYAHSRPSSRHPGIVIATFCDGRVVKISDTIDNVVYRHIMTPYGVKAAKNPWDVDSGSYDPLNDDDIPLRDGIYEGNIDGN